MGCFVKCNILFHNPEQPYINRAF